LMAASALICGRTTVRNSDLWILKYIWDTEEQREILSALVQPALAKAERDESDHIRVRQVEGPNPESLARDLDFIDQQLSQQTNGRSAYLRDRLSLIEGRCQWVADAAKRDFLTRRVSELWARFQAIPESKT
jgi:MoxR-like ATPase